MHVYLLLQMELIILNVKAVQLLLFRGVSLILTSSAARAVAQPSSLLTLAVRNVMKSSPHCISIMFT